MKVLVIGAGGREHALAWKLAQSEQVKQVFVAPGNGGTAHEAKCVNVNPDDVLTFAQTEGIDLTVVGPEAPLAAGLVDTFEAHGLKAWGPKAHAAKLESSKALAKAFMQRHNIPHAASESFTDFHKALAYVRAAPHPIVIKASGLAAGKGVILPDTLAEAEQALTEIMQQRVFGDAGDEVVIEARLSGPEVSVFAFSDGEHVALMPACQDHKRALDGDQGLNTGGMGAYCPAPIATPEILTDILTTVIQPTIAGMKAEGTPYVGVLYAGMMLTPDGPKTLEFNCRFGDPETQVLLPLLQSDLFDIMLASVEGRLDEIALSWSTNYAVTVVLASGGYPQTYETGKAISGLTPPDHITLFHAGTKVKDNATVTSGGRVLSVGAQGNTLQDAVAQVYTALPHITFENRHYRRDIAAKAL